MLARGDGVGDTLVAADLDDVVGLEAAVGAHGQWAGSSGRRTRLTVSRRKLAAPRVVLALPLRSLAISTSPVPAAMANSG